MWNKEKAVSYLHKNTHRRSIARCAKYVREAIEAGGVMLMRVQSAKDYGSSLLKAGFIEISYGDATKIVAGDVAIIQIIEGHIYGHMTMYDGKQWISDFRKNEMYPGYVI